MSLEDNDVIFRRPSPRLALIQRLERVRSGLREDGWHYAAEVITDAISEISHHGFTGDCSIPPNASKER